MSNKYTVMISDYSEDAVFVMVKAERPLDAIKAAFEKMAKEDADPSVSGDELEVMENLLGQRRVVEVIYGHVEIAELKQREVNKVLKKLERENDRALEKWRDARND